MEQIFINGKTYVGDCILRDSDFLIYVLNKIQDKYLILHRKDNIVQDMVLTGLDKVIEIIRLIKGKIDEKELKKQINKGIENIKKQCYNKSLKSLDKQKLKESLTSFYDNSYPIFVFLGIKLPDLLQSEIGIA